MSARAVIGGAEVDLVDERAALRAIATRLDAPAGRPLGVVSINLDHVHHLRNDPSFGAALTGGDIDWLSLIDGAPIAARARSLTGRPWPRLAGSDLIDPILRAAAGHRLGVLGGTADAHRLLRARLAAAHPRVQIAGTWAPARDELADPEASRGLAYEIADAGVDVLLVALGKPRQERWIARHGAASGARVLLAFGAVVDFLAGTVARAPAAVASVGMEWAWRLALEPRRLARRYLVQGPPALAAVQRSARMLPPPPATRPVRPLPADRGRFVTGEDPAEATVVIVTYNSGAEIDALLDSLRGEAVQTALRVVVADNSSSDDTVARIRRREDVTLVRTGGNLGYSAGINAAQRAAPLDEHRLILNPDLVVRPGAVRALLDRLAASRAGIVAPAVVDADGQRTPSVRREPSLTRALGDAVLGAHWRGRPTWLSDMDWRDEDYGSAHPIDWASGAALLVRAEVAAAIRWEERFFLYSEETELQRRVRDAGWEVWFEPGAVVQHRQGGSGASNALVALSEVNRVRYIRRHHGRAYTSAYRGAVALHNAARIARPGARHALGVVLRGAAWRDLPGPRRDAAPLTGIDSASGSIVIPAHDEETLIGTTLRSLRPLLEAPGVEVVVVANGCSDATADRARSVPGVRVVEIAEAGKPGALNAGDAAVAAWPRLYLDADIAIPPATVLALFAALDDPRVEAARPASRYDVTGADPLVRAFYRARDRMPSLHRALWGAGAYALSEAGRARFGAFPHLVADDLFVDRSIPRERVAVVPAAPAIVRTPTTRRALLSTLRRVARGNGQQGGASTTSTTVRELLLSVRSPLSAVDALVYAGFVLAARRARPAAEGVRWERDTTRRTERS